MAMSEDEEAKLKQEHAETKKQLMELLEKNKSDENAAKEAETKRSKEKPGKVELDPDIVKEVGELKAKMAKIEGKLGGDSGSTLRLNFFKE